MRALAFSGDGTMAVIGDGPVAVVVRLADGHVLRRFGRVQRSQSGSDNNLCSVATEPHGQFVVAVEYDNDIRVWDIMSGELVRHIKVKGGGMQVNATFTPDGRRLLTGGPLIQLWDIRSGRLLRAFEDVNFKPGTVGYTVVLSPDGRTVLTDRGYCALWDLETGKRLHLLMPADESARHRASE